MAINPNGRLPGSGFVRAADLCRNPRLPAHVPILPISAATLWRMVKAGTFPQPVQLCGSQKLTAWRVEAVAEWIDRQQGNKPRPRAAPGASRPIDLP
jgi:prophage regulatory protein